MKLRKSLVAAATALTVATAGTTVALADDSNAPDAYITQTEAENKEEETKPEEQVAEEDATDEAPAEDDKAKEDETKDEDEKTDDLSSNLFGSSLKDQDPKDVKAWIGVFTAVIGALGALFTFVQKYL